RILDVDRDRVTEGDLVGAAVGGAEAVDDDAAVRPPRVLQGNRATVSAGAPAARRGVVNAELRKILDGRESASRSAEAGAGHLDVHVLSNAAEVDGRYARCRSIRIRWRRGLVLDHARPCRAAGACRRAHHEDGDPIAGHDLVLAAVGGTEAVDDDLGI